MITCKDCIHYFVCEFKPKTNLVSQCADHIDRSCFVEFPCAVGDTVYYILLGHILSEKVDKMEIHKNNVKRIITDSGWGLYPSYIFRGSEEAEAALKERIGREAEVE